MNLATMAPCFVLNCNVSYTFAKALIQDTDWSIQSCVFWYLQPFATTN